MHAMAMSGQYYQTQIRGLRLSAIMNYQPIVLPKGAAFPFDKRVVELIARPGR